MKRNSATTMLMAAVVIMGVSGIVQANKNEDRIESSAKKSHVFMTYLKDDDVKVKVMNDSVVILTGTVSQWSHRSLAEETVAGLPGIKRVDNQLEVTGGKPDEKSDGWIGMKVKTILLFHQNVSGINTEVDVNNGVVTLRGQASSEAQKELTAEYAMDVDGVKSVNNELVVGKDKKTTMEKMGTKIDDASITAQVKVSLLFHRSTSAINIKVETKNGIVTVRGTARNEAEKDLVGKLVSNIKGVKGLKNEITIGEMSSKGN